MGPGAVALAHVVVRGGQVIGGADRLAILDVIGAAKKHNCNSTINK